MLPRDHLQRDVPVEPGFCYVLMPFTDEMRSVYEYGIRPALERLSMRCERADEHFASSNVMTDIFEGILRAEVVIADLTGKNPNVFYELGLAHAIKSHVILITQRPEDVPFDLTGVRYFKYENSMAGAKVLAEHLERIIHTLRAPSDAEFEVRDAQKLLERGFKTWSATRTVALEAGQLSELIVYLDRLNLDDQRVAFLAVAAAQLGRHMHTVVRRARTTVLAIESLVDVVAVSTARRPTWRATAMLEHLDQPMVHAIIAGRFNDQKLANDRRQLLGAARAGQTTSYLRQFTKLKDISPETRDRAEEALRQILGEFGEPHTADG